MCRSREQRELGHTGNYRWAECRKCRSAYVDREVPVEELEAYYADYYDDSNLAVPDIVQVRLSEQVRAFAAFQTTGRLLDVGFGAGTLLAVAHEAGWECWGTEISPASVDLGRARGWQVLAGDLPDLVLEAGAFDVVCMVELLEHVPNPLEQIAAARRLLRPGGLLFGTTPNTAGVSARVLGTRWSAFAPPEHLQLLTPRSLARALRGSGFTDVRVTTRGVNPHELRQGLRRRALAGRDRVASAYALNEALQRSRRGRVLRAAVNLGLGLTRLGDSLRFSAN